MLLSHYQPERYQTLLQEKLAVALPRFKDHYRGEVNIYASPPSHYRMRAEFRMWHDGDNIDFVMFDGPGKPVTISDFPVASQHINDRMPRLKVLLEDNEILKGRLFQVEFLTTTGDDTLISLIYHKKLDEHWQTAARQLQQKLGTQIIGRSRKQKLVLGRDYVTEQLTVNGRRFSYRQMEGVFTQPNASINTAMIEWVSNQLGDNNDDLLELYCGIGNFTLPLSRLFRRVLATEISKQAVACAHHNIAANGVENISLARMSSEEFTQAMDGVRPFRRLKDIALEDFHLNTVLVDPPRAGLDAGTLALVSRAQRIVYISCNPETLLQNLAELGQTHSVEGLAIFDQFPYTDHLECGVILRRK